MLSFHFQPNGLPCFDHTETDVGSPVDTLILTRSQVADLLEPRILLGALRDAFVKHSNSRTVEAMRIPVPLPASEAAVGASGMLVAPGFSYCRY
jgi:hypothetical protein